MLEKLVNYIDKLFIEITTLESAFNSSGLKREEALDLTKRACSITKNPCSLFHIIYDLYRLSDKKVESEKELSMRINLLIIKYNFQNDFSIVRQEPTQPFLNLVDSVSSILPNEQLALTEDYVKEITNINCIKTTKSLVTLGRKYIKIAKEYIQDHIFKYVALKSRVKESNRDYNITPYELDYLNNWINNTIEYRDLSHNSFYDLDDLISSQKLSHQITEQINKKRAKLFKEGLKRKLKSLKDDLSEVNEEKRRQTIITHKTLIDKFLLGDLSQILIDRINIFIQLHNPDKVIMEYDRLLRYDYFSSYELNVFSPKSFRSYSPTFTAQLLFDYLNHLNNLINQDNSNKISSASTKTKLINPKVTKSVSTVTNRLSFKFTGDEEKLKAALKSLILQIDLLPDDRQINYLFDILTADDLSEFSEPIRINCETKQFGYLINALKICFLNLNPTTVESSKLFNSKKNTLLTATNLYLKGNDPKRSEIIDNILYKLK